MARSGCATIASAFLPIYTFGKVAMFNRVPFDSISLRDCTSKGEGFVVMSQPSASISTSTRTSQNERLAPRERSLEGTHLVYVSSIPLSQLLVEDFDPSQWIIIMCWAVGEPSVGDVPLPPRKALGLSPSPPLPPPGHHPLRVPPQQLRTPSKQGTDHFRLMTIPCEQ